MTTYQRCVEKVRKTQTPHGYNPRTSNWENTPYGGSWRRVIAPAYHGRTLRPRRSR